MLAKADVVGAKTGVSSTVKCKFTAGTELDALVVEANAPGQPADQVPVALQVTADLPVAGAATLVCGTDDGPFKVGKVRISAFQAGTLTTRLLGDVGTTTGTGNPVVVSGHAPGGFTVAPAAFTLVASLPLPAGSYAVSATARLVWWSGAAVATACQLRLGADYDQSIVRQEAGILPAAPMALQAVHTFAASGSAELWCLQSGTSGQISLYDAQITAVAAESLANGGI